MNTKPIIAIILLLAVTGCTTPKEKDEIDAIKTMELSQGWKLSAIKTGATLEIEGYYTYYQKRGAFEVIEFANPELLCKQMVMVPYAETSVIFFNKEMGEETKKEIFSNRPNTPGFKTKNYIVLYSKPCYTGNPAENEMEQKIEKALEPYAIERIQ